MTSQFQLLNKILSTKDFSIITLNNLNSDYFFDYKAEFEFIKNHYDKFKVVPDTLTFLESFPDFKVEDVQEPCSYLIDQLYKDYNQAYLAKQFNTIKNLLEADKVEEALKLYSNMSTNLHQGGALTCTNVLSDTSRYDRYLDRSINKDKYYISTGFPELDRIIGGIDRENENMVIVARTGIGKSWTLLKMAAAASMQGLTVGIYSGEMSVDKVAYRLDSLLGHVDNKSITRGDLYVQNEYKKYIDTLAHTTYGPIKVVTPNDISGPATVAALQAFVEQEHIEILFIDQYSLLEDDSHARAGFERVGNISKAIKNLQVMKQIPIISVSQQNRTKNEDGSQDTTQIGLSDRIGQDATSIIMLDKKDKELNLFIAKARDGGDGKKLTYTADFNTGIFTYIPAEGDNISSEEDFEDIANSYETTDGSFSY